MSYGIKVVTDSGQVIDSSIIPGTLYDIFVVGGADTGSKSYPELQGFTIYASVQKFAAQPNAITNTSVTYPSGYPVLNWFPSGSSATPAPATITVFAK
jgi:hypothetical protein